MTLFFPDVNVWLALSFTSHVHASSAWQWLRDSPQDRKLAFCRQTQLGLLRLLTNPAVMGERMLVLRLAWSTYDRWLEDPFVEYYPEPRDLELAFRELTQMLAPRQGSKAVGDCFLLAYASELGATLVTFDRGLYAFARKRGLAVVNPAA